MEKRFPDRPAPKGLYKMKGGKISSVRVYCTLNAYNPKVFGRTEATDG